MAWISLEQRMGMLPEEAEGALCSIHPHHRQAAWTELALSIWSWWVNYPPLLSGQDSQPSEETQSSSTVIQEATWSQPRIQWMELTKVAAIKGTTWKVAPAGAQWRYGLSESQGKMLNGGTQDIWFRGDWG